jgi:hypothetical protein
VKSLVQSQVGVDLRMIPSTRRREIAVVLVCLAEDAELNRLHCADVSGLEEKHQKVAGQG